MTISELRRPRGGSGALIGFGPRAEQWWTNPARFVTSIIVITSIGLAVDQLTDVRTQALLGLGNALLLGYLLCWFTREQRAQTLCVVVIATGFEVIGSIVWGLYTYRLGNLPLFVPTGHGLVYLTGLRISQSRFARQRPWVLIGGTVAFAFGWAAVGLSGVLGRVDAAGAFGVVVVSAAIIWGRVPTVYAGVFLFVAFLEIYGTAVGTWQWAPYVPGLGVPNGNPPSGAASGYVVFDLFALATAPRVLRALAAISPRPAPWSRRPATRPGSAAEPDPGRPAAPARR